MKGERPLFPKDQLVSEDTRKRWRDRLDFVMDNCEELFSEWEEGFVQDVEIRLSDGKDLSLSQSSKLNEIFHKVEEAVG